MAQWVNVLATKPHDLNPGIHMVERTDVHKLSLASTCSQVGGSAGEVLAVQDLRLIPRTQETQNLRLVALLESLCWRGRHSQIC